MPTTKAPETPPISPIGRDTPRVDGPLKVSGKAQYTSDFHFPGMLYAVPVEATIASGKVTKLDTAAAEKMPGVRAIFHRENIGKIFRSIAGPGFDGICEERRPPFEDDVVRYYGQYVALAVAHTFETAKAAADAVRVTYAKEKPNVETDLQADDDPDVVMTSFGPRHRKDSERGDVEGAFARAPVKLDQTYVTPIETHNPLELHATTAIWNGSNLTLYESSQGVVNLRSVLAQMFGLPNENVRVITKFVGSGFGGKLWPWTQCPLAAAAARQLGKPVKLVVSRKMMFQSVGHRPRTQQRIRLGATAEGKLVALHHDYVYTTSMLDAHHEDCGEATPFHYNVPNLRVTFGRAKRHIGAGADMRGPGAVPGLYATESAMNELADQLKIDPVKLRIINEPKLDEGLGLPFSSRHLLECFELGGQKFGWSKRTPAVGSMKRDGLTLGWGVAGCTWIAARFASEASLQLRDDGTVRVACATQDIGTGTYTILAQLASHRTGVPLDKVEVELGDTSLPAGPISGGSLATSSVVPAVFSAAEAAITSLLTTAVMTPGSPFEKRKPEELAFEDGRVFLKSDGAAKGVPFGELLKRANLRLVSGGGKSEATFGNPKPKFSTHSFGCHFVEVTWQPEIARLRVSRVVTVIDAGHIINPLAGRNQIVGAVVMGIGMALLRCAACDAAMIHSPVSKGVKKTKQYRYYVCTNAQKRGYDQCPCPSLPADWIEKEVVGRLNQSFALPISRTGERRTGLAEQIAEMVETVEFNANKKQLAINLTPLGAERLKANVRHSKRNGNPNEIRSASNGDDSESRLEFDVDFMRSSRRRALRCKPTRSNGNPLAPENSATDNGVSRIARSLALAHQIERAVLDGRAPDYRTLARQMSISRPRIGQIVGLTQLAPAIQDRILFDEAGAFAAISPRDVERVAEVLDWREQARQFEKLASNADPERRTRPISS